MGKQAAIVLGLHFGDEGKGAVVNALSNNNQGDIVVRFNGGRQAGHTVIRDGKRHVFSHFGSGTLAGLPTYWSQYAYADPVAFLEEEKEIMSLAGVPVFYIHPMTPLVTPFDILANQADVTDHKNGTCGLGIGKAAKRHEETPFKLYVQDIRYPWVLEKKVEAIRERYFHSSLSNDLIKLLDDKQEMFLTACHEFFSKVVITELNGIFPFNGKIIFEGAQGILLDRDHGFFPYVTRSHTGSTNALKILGELGGDLWPHIYMVTRPYLTRHGFGPLPGEGDLKVDLLNAENETNINNPWQGPFRKAPFHRELYHYASSHERDNGYRKTVVVTCLDQFPGKIPYTDFGNIPREADKDEFLTTISRAYMSAVPISSLSPE